jgi:hypothetical protein
VLAVGLATACPALWLACSPAGRPAPSASGGTLRLDWSGASPPGARYRVEVRVDGAVASVDTARAPAGTLAVRRDVALPAGTHSVNVAMTRLPPITPTGDAASAAVPPSVLPDTLQYVGLVTLAPGEVVAVSYEPRRRWLMVHRPGAE